jgi:hypothetical protein
MRRVISLLTAAGLLLAAPLVSAGEHPCDFDGSGEFDQADKDAILAVQGEVVVPGSTFDLDGDGVISLRDASMCTQASQ